MGDRKAPTPPPTDQVRPDPPPPPPRKRFDHYQPHDTPQGPPPTGGTAIVSSTTPRSTTNTETLDKADGDALLLALATLAAERPGWVTYLGALAEKVTPNPAYGRRGFDDFLKCRRLGAIQGLGDAQPTDLAAVDAAASWLAGIQEYPLCTPAAREMTDFLLKVLGRTRPRAENG